MIVVAAVLVISNKDDRILPEGAVPYSIYYLRNKCLPPLDVRRRMLVIFILDPPFGTPGSPKFGSTNATCGNGGS